MLICFAEESPSQSTLLNVTIGQEGCARICGESQSPWDVIVILHFSTVHT